VQARIDKGFTPVLYEAPHAPEQPAALRFVALAGAEKGPRIIDLLVDLVTLDFVTWHYTVPGFLRVIIRLHGNLLMGRAGRVYVGWLGLAMLALGISGLILWWPGRKRWRAAFLVKRGARGLRLYRDLHNAIGIWTLVVLMTVSFSGVYLVFPQTVGAGIKRLLPSRDNDSPAPIVRDEGAQRIDADRAIAIALSTTPRARLISIGLPVLPEQPYRVSLAHPGHGRDVPEVVALINSSGTLIELIDPRRFAPAQTVLAWQHAIHFGQGLGIKHYHGEPAVDTARRYSPGVVIGVRRHRLIGYQRRVCSAICIAQASRGIREVECLLLLKSHPRIGPGVVFTATAPWLLTPAASIVRSAAGVIQRCRASPFF
jgi:uncharacterized iron-regulated membrane protein